MVEAEKASLTATIPWSPSPPPDLRESAHVGASVVSPGPPVQPGGPAGRRASRLDGSVQGRETTEGDREQHRHETGADSGGKFKMGSPRRSKTRSYAEHEKNLAKRRSTSLLSCGGPAARGGDHEGVLAGRARGDAEAVQGGHGLQPQLLLQGRRGQDGAEVSDSASRPAARTRCRRTRATSRWRTCRGRKRWSSARS